MASVRIFVVICFVANSADAVHVQVDRLAKRCDPTEAAQVWELLKTKSFAQLRGSPCVSNHSLSLYEQGKADPLDAVEYLGARILGQGFGLQQVPQCKKTLLPSMLYLGMEHAGSTTLASALDSHRSMSFGQAKEHRFWTKFGQEKHAVNDLEYLSEFEVDCGVEMTFDATPNMFALPITSPAHDCHVTPGQHGQGIEALQSLQKLLGNDVLFLVMIRDPVKVMQSIHWRGKFRANAQRGIRFCECFVEGLKVWKSNFPANQFMFLESGDLFEHPNETMSSVFDFLGVESQPIDVNSAGRRRSTAEPALSQEELETYWKGIQPCQQELSEITNINLTWARASGL